MTDRMGQNTAPVGWANLAGFLMLAAGMVHLLIVPHHLEHSLGHGLFMAFSALIEIAWTVVIFVRVSQRAAIAGALIAAALIVLWTLTRIFPAPFGDGGPEEVDAAGIACLVLEAGVILALIPVLSFFEPGRWGEPGRKTEPGRWNEPGQPQGSVPVTGRPRRLRPSASIATMLLIGVMLGVGTYELASMVQPLFPGLARQENIGLPMQH